MLRHRAARVAGEVRFLRHLEHRPFFPHCRQLTLAERERDREREGGESTEGIAYLESVGFGPAIEKVRRGGPGVGIAANEKIPGHGELEEEREGEEERGCDSGHFWRESERVGDRSGIQTREQT